MWALPDIAIGLGLLAGFLAAYGLLYGYNYSLGALLRGIAWFLNNLRVNAWFISVNIGAWLGKEVVKLDHGIQHVLGAFVLTMDRAMGAFLHANARLVTELAHWVEGLPADVLNGFHWVAHHRIARAVATALFPIYGLIRATQALVKGLKAAVAYEIKHARAQIHAIAHATTVALPHRLGHTNARVGRLEHDLKGIAAHRARILTLITLAGFTGFMWKGFDRMGLRWFRCPAFARLGSRIGCGGFAFLEGLLALSFDAWLVTDLCRIVDVMTSAARLFAKEIDYLAGQITDLIKCQNASRAKALPVAWHEPPPVVESILL